MLNGPLVRSLSRVPHVPSRLVLNTCRSGDTPDLTEGFHARGTRWLIALRGAQWGSEIDLADFMPADCGQLGQT
ncbi:MAG TPA: hypothetical protein ENK31_01760 [Nannocystis exedens]|nr:hypothetical protein [Nannocystis exedens]